MKLPEIRRLVGQYSLDELQAAENQLLSGLPLAIDVHGDDEGEQLTHIMAAAEVLRDIHENGTDPRDALRNYTQRVRDSIS